MGADLQTEHERYLTEKVFKKPVFVTDYPKAIKAFYMRLNDDGRTVAAMDLLVPGVGEIIGGSQREERLPLLEARMDECGLDFADYWWYLELRKYGGTSRRLWPGFERAIMYLTGMTNIRDVLPSRGRSIWPNLGGFAFWRIIFRIISAASGDTISNQDQSPKFGREPNCSKRRQTRQRRAPMKTRSSWWLTAKP